ncbi:hypothetical protein HF086_004977 [Spodoptera exigua]|uniref:THAP-type domain-containing protein n=1 Tax=Spodoptera exigua TaxID=7107 RepID=A0A922S8V6_SPOEX|nr:hypothetical protein HF086_004977 [Spodoptera exigua]
MKVVNWTPKMYNYPCSKHFTDDCFTKHQSRTTLKKCKTNSSSLETETSKEADQLTEYQCEKDIEMSLDEFNSPSVPVEVRLLNDEVHQKEICMLPCEALAVPSTSYNTSNCSTPAESRTLAEIISSVKLDHRYDNTQIFKK